MQTEFDFIIVGSGFGGSVSALRLAEKGYRVLVLEKGRRFARADFALDNTDFKRWMWAPELGARGIYQMSFLRHVTILHGVGVGGGSLVYANTLPQPKRPFFASSSWAHLADWEKELEAFYSTDDEVPATLTVDVNVYLEVGVHFRGASSFLFVPEGSKRSMNLSVDWVHDDQRLLGYRTLNLLNVNSDPTFRFLTEPPTSTTSPINSCPMMSPGSIIARNPL